jgi:hypothetical protein
MNPRRAAPAARMITSMRAAAAVGGRATAAREAILHVREDAARPQNGEDTGVQPARASSEFVCVVRVRASASVRRTARAAGGVDAEDGPRASTPE